MMTWRDSSEIDWVVGLGLENFLHTSDLFGSFPAVESIQSQIAFSLQRLEFLLEPLPSNSFLSVVFGPRAMYFYRPTPREKTHQGSI